MRSIGAAALAGAARLAGQTVGGSNRSLVSIELLGGEDSNNLLVPLDAANYSVYATGRGALALARSALRPIESGRHQAAFGFPAEMPEIASLYQRNALAIVANVGDLPFPMSKAQYLANPSAVPADVFEHSGNSKRTYSTGAALSPSWAGAVLQQSHDEFNQRLFRFSTGLTSAAASGGWFQGTRLDDPDVLQVMKSVNVQTEFPDSGLGPLMLQAVKLAVAGPMLGIGNQIITISMGGWDTHVDELNRISRLHVDLSQALGAFYEAAQELRVWNNVTVFTSTEFNRRLAPNDSGGSDHGWGGHRLVLGGSVKGGEVYGRFPSLALGGADDVSGQGTWLPAIASQQMASTLAGWWGLDPGTRASVFPGWSGTDLGLFSASAAAA